jgi:hypothetical protein
MYERSTEKGSVWVTMKQCECSSQFTGAVLCVIGVVEESKSDLMCIYVISLDRIAGFVHAV